MELLPGLKDIVPVKTVFVGLELTNN